MNSPTSPFQGIADKFAAEADNICQDQRAQARREFAGQLNQAVRRIRQAETREHLGDTVIDIARTLASGAIWFQIEDGMAHSEKLRATIPLKDAAALQQAIETKEPVVSMATPKEVSPQLVERFAHSSESRAFVYPVFSAGKPAALLYAWGDRASDSQTEALELLAQVASAVWQNMERPAPPAAQPTSAPVFVSLAPAPPVTPKPAPTVFAPLAPPTPMPTTPLPFAAVLASVTSQSASSTPVPTSTPPPATTTAAPVKTADPWDALSVQEQELHLRAQRFARVQVAEMRLRKAAAVQSGRMRRNLYASLRDSIDAARDTFRKEFLVKSPSMVDYLHLELTRTLANDDAALLGKEYPGPIV